MKRQTVARLLAITLSAAVLFPCTAYAAQDQITAGLTAQEQETPDTQTGQEAAKDVPKQPDQTEAEAAGDEQSSNSGEQQAEISVEEQQESSGISSQSVQATPQVQREEQDTGGQEEQDISGSAVTDAPEEEKKEDETDSPETEEKDAVSGSWIRSGSRWWYQYRDGSYPRSCWQAIDGSWYYFDAAGWMVTGWQQIGGVWYYMNGSGQMVTGWQQIGGSWYYMDASGRMVTGWQKVNGIWYYMNGSGQMVTGWQYLNGSWYYLDGSGRMVTGWAYVGGVWYYMNGSGQMVTGWQKVNGIWYYMDSSGRMLTGWQYLGGVWYYMNGSGQMMTGWQQIGGIYYYLQPSGAMAADTWIGDWYVDGSGAWIEGKKKVFEEGWINTNGLWWYQYEDGSYAKSGWKTIDGKEYYFDSAGWMKTGWLKLNGTWYYLNADGSKAYDQWIGNTGVGGYYIDKYGKMVANGEYSLNYSVYTFDKDGKCTAREDRYVTMKDPINGKNYLLERQILTDPQVSDDELLAAAVYAEAGNQKMPGMTGVALVMLNRCASSEYPSSVRFMLYQNQQFEVARNGMLSKYLNDIGSSYLDDAKKAVAAARKILEDYQKNGTPRTVEGLTMPEGKTDFDYMGFMTPAAFKNAGLDWEATDAFTYLNTTFYTRWIKEKS